VPSFRVQLKHSFEILASISRCHTKTGRVTCLYRITQLTSFVKAHAYERDGNDTEAFKFFYRHASLVMNKVATHPDLKLDPKNLTAWKKARSEVAGNLNKLEDLKPRIKKRNAEYTEMMARRDAEREQWQKEHKNDSNQSYNTLIVDVENMSLGSQRGDGYGYNQPTLLDPAKNADLAVKLAHTELGGNRQSKAAKQQSPLQPPKRSSAEKIKSGRGQSFLYDESDDELTHNMIAIGQRQQEISSQPKKPASQHQSNDWKDAPSSVPYYPSVPKQSKKQESSWYRTSPTSSPSPNTRSSHFASSLSKPARPPKEYFYGSDAPPPVPQKFQPPSPPSGTLEAPDTSATALNSKNYSFKTSAKSESGAPLRTVFINPKLRSMFLTIALANTERNLETCGILCGELLSNAFFISKLVIPEQESTSDTCDTVNEGALFDYCDSENLMTLGWIHTHPTQTCFMSSRDLHTHGGYQVQLAESVAIVCAPRHTPS
jgi:STAM-binding protein